MLLTKWEKIGERFQVEGDNHDTFPFHFVSILVTSVIIVIYLMGRTDYQEHYGGSSPNWHLLVAVKISSIGTFVPVTTSAITVIRCCQKGN